MWQHVTPCTPPSLHNPTTQSRNISIVNCISETIRANHKHKSPTAKNISTLPTWQTAVDCKPIHGAAVCTGNKDTHSSSLHWTEAESMDASFCSCSDYGSIHKASPPQEIFARHAWWKQKMSKLNTTYIYIYIKFERNTKHKLHNRNTETDTVVRTRSSRGWHYQQSQ
jgi:hypothetical protein